MNNNLRSRYIPLSYNSKIPLKSSRYKTQQYYTDAELYGNNIGIRTGNGLCVLDLDSQQIINEWLSNNTVFNVPLPNTYTVKTRKGYHLYYKCSTNIPTRLNLDNQGIDIKSGINGYVVGAGSVVNGIRYISNSNNIEWLPIGLLEYFNSNNNTEIKEQRKTINEILSLLEIII